MIGSRRKTVLPNLLPAAAFVLMLALLMILVFWGRPMAVAGQSLAIALDPQSPRAGEMVTLTLVSLTTEESLAVLPDELVCELNKDGEKLPLLAKSRPQEGTRPGLRSYYFRVPAELQGPVTASFPRLQAPAVVLQIQTALPPPEVPPDDREEPGAYTSLDSLFSLYQPYRLNTSAYLPTYFLVGTDPSESKFQLSFKYRLFDPDSNLVSRYAWLRGLHFGYTQTSFWDLNSPSIPFADSSYKPELFWLSGNLLERPRGLLQGIFLQTGARHESNGKGGEDSRSTNTLYLQPILVLYDREADIGLGVSGRLQNYLINDETNDDLADYRGYLEFEAKLGRATGAVIGTGLRLAAEGASFQADFSYPLHRLFGNALDLYFFAEYVNVLGERLIEYNERSEAFRLGIAIIR